MTQIRLTNSATRRKEDFAPLDAGNVRVYVCGPTVYDRAHMGNARPAIVFDVLYRLLRHVYGADHVTYVRNITDVDDKINARAAETGRPIREITDETTTWYLDDMAALGNLVPDATPRATDYIDRMIAMIETLIARGHAYAAEGHVLFSVASHDGYGRLSGRSVEDMLAGARVEVAPYKRDPMDFVLWKPSGPGQPGWDSPWGTGRPGWHIECSAMAADLLGERFDIHGGGNDLIFPHHENEIAQSACAHDGAAMAQVWLHNEMLQVEGRKMSKSLGNFFTVRDLLDRGIPGEVIRFVFLGTHYRKPMDWTAEKAEIAKQTLRHWAELADETASGPPDPEIVEELGEDLNTPEAIALLHEMAADDRRADLTNSARFLGLDLVQILELPWAKPFQVEVEAGKFWTQGDDFLPTIGVIGFGPIPDKLVDVSSSLVYNWLDLRRRKEWSQADKIRDDAAAIGIELRATRSAHNINGGTASLRHDSIRVEDVERLATRPLDWE